MGLTYKDSGVDIDAGNALVSRIKNAVQSTHRDGVLSDLGGFGGLFELARHKYEHPVLVSGTDGVGTKLKLAQQLKCHDSIGIDLVAMCVNDVFVQGAEPLFFLDYFATGKLQLEVSEDVITGIAHGCRLAGAALIGGETAEMPGMYADGEYDLAGFCVAVAEKSELITGQAIEKNDLVIGLHSSGIHSNGFSLVNKLLATTDSPLSQTFHGSTLGATLLTPTTIYVSAILDMLAQVPIKGLCHVTGGGITENLPRILPPNTRADIDTHAWQRLPIFDWIQTLGDISDQEMLRVFNCGIGMIVVIAEEYHSAITQTASKHNIASDIIGRIETTDEAVHVNYI